MDKLKVFEFKESDKLVSFEVCSLFTNVPLDETIGLILGLGMKIFFPICSGFGGQISCIKQKHQNFGRKKASEVGNISIYKSMSF